MQMLDEGGLLPLPCRIAGIFLKGCCECICVPRLEEHHVLGRREGLVLFYGVVHAVFPRHTVKILDVFIADLDIGNALILTDKLLDRLLAGGLYGTSPFFLCNFCFLMCQELRNRRLEHPSGELRCADYKGHCPVFNLFLQL